MRKKLGRLVSFSGHVLGEGSAGCQGVAESYLDSKSGGSLRGMGMGGEGEEVTAAVLQRALIQCCMCLVMSQPSSRLVSSFRVRLLPHTSHIIPFHPLPLLFFPRLSPPFRSPPSSCRVAMVKPLKSLFDVVQ